MALPSQNIKDLDKANFKENPSDGGVDRRVNDLGTRNKLDEVITAISGITGAGNSTLYYNEVTSVAAGALTTIVTHTVTGTKKLIKITSSGTNIAAYQVELNGTVIAKKYTNFGSELSVDIEFNGGVSLVLNDVIRIRVLHARVSSGDFNGTLIIQD